MDCQDRGIGLEEIGGSLLDRPSSLAPTLRPLDDLLTCGIETLVLSEVSLTRLQQRLMSKGISLAIGGADRLYYPGQLAIQDPVQNKGRVGGQDFTVLHRQRARGRGEHGDGI